jgi:esterase/lipase superfamily enzyme
MLTRILLVLAALGLGAGIASSQSQLATDLDLPAPCRAKAAGDKAAEGLGALEKRKESLERQIAKARATKPAAEEAGARKLTKTQAALLDVLFQIQCHQLRQQALAQETASAGPPAADRTSAARPKRRVVVQQPADAPAAGAPEPAALPPPPAPTRRAVRADAAPATAIEVTTYFATNRGLSGKSTPATLYDAKVSPLSYGRAVVTIPSTHSPGSLELPSVWRVQLRPDPKRHFTLKSAVPLTIDEVRSEMAQRLAGLPSKAILVFVHGYNMSFAETAMRTAQLAYDLEFPGLPFFFSWPSVAQVTGYLRDTETAQLSEEAFDQMLDDLARLPAGEIYVIAHSMGSRLVSQALRSRVDKGKPTAHLRELLLAAPDINVDLFRSTIAPRLKAMQAMQTTVYASSSDLALMASKAVHGYRRVGETAGGVFVYPGFDTVDASAASLAMRAFGHSYLTDSAAVLKDIRSLLRQKLSAKARGLTEAGIRPDVYWSLR